MRPRGAALLGLAIGLTGCQLVFGVEPSRDAGPVSPDGEPIPTGWAMIRTGSNHTCAIDQAQHLWCWGRGIDGQLGNGTARSRNLPGRVEAVGTDRWTAVALGAAHTCGVQTDGSTWCWGNNDHRQLGFDDEGPHLVPRAVSGAGGAVELAAGTFQTCILDGEGDLLCWGANADYRLAQDDPMRDYLPIRVGGDGGWTGISLQGGYACGVRAGEVYCWGTITIPPMTTTQMTPTQIAGLNPPMAEVDVGVDHVCARNEAGALWCWGAGGQGQLGGGTTMASQTPVLVPGSWSGLGVAATSTCALAGAALSCWGTIDHGRIGLDDADNAPNVNVPTEVGAGVAWRTISTFERHLCGLDQDGAAWCTGLDGDGQVGDGDGGPRRAPTLVASNIDEVTVGASFACSRSGAEVRCWGQGTGGRLGTGRARPERVPTPIAAPMSWAPTSISAGLGAACALSEPGGVHCWGRDDAEVVGVAAATSVIPVARPNPPPWALPLVALDVTNHACVIDNAQRGYCWGENTDGQVSAAMGTPVVQPTEVSPNAALAHITVGTAHTCFAVGAAVTCQGSNQQGQLGHANEGPIPGVMGDAGLDAGASHTCAIAVDGRLWCWGRNVEGQAGTTPAASVAPFQLESSWEQVAAGDDFTCAIEQPSQDLRCWGNTRNGQLGVDTTVDVEPQPQLVRPGTSWREVAAGGDTACAISMQRELFCWGNNEHGQVGDGSAWQYVMARVGGP